MISTPRKLPFQALDRPHLRAGCPITRANFAEVGRKRQAMLSGGYRLVAVHTPWSLAVDLANAGKQPLTEVVDDKKVPWTWGHSHERLVRITALSANTGLVLGGDGALVALDIDPAKDANEIGQRAFTMGVLRFLTGDPMWPQLRRAPLRLRDAASIVMIFCADKSMTKIKVAGQRGAVELLGEGQHAVVDGWHPQSLDGRPVLWRWHGERSPWTVPARELPVVPAADTAALMQRIASSGVLGALRQSGANTAVVAGAARATAYAATARLHTLFEKHDGRVRPAIRDLVEQIGAEGCGRHDAVVAIAGRVVLQKWSNQQALDFLVPLANQHFQDGDWTDEILAALQHARRRDTERVQRIRGVTWS